MKIASATNGNTLEDLVAEEFDNSKFLLIVETENMSFEVFSNAEGRGGSGLTMAKKVIDSNCEAIISGSIGRPAFEEVALAQVTRYYGAGISTKEALYLMEDNKLQMVREYKGGEGRYREHHQRNCNCGHHEE